MSQRELLHKHLLSLLFVSWAFSQFFRFLSYCTGFVHFCCSNKAFFQMQQTAVLSKKKNKNHRRQSVHNLPNTEGQAAVLAEGQKHNLNEWQYDVNLKSNMLVLCIKKNTAHTSFTIIIQTYQYVPSTSFIHFCFWWRAGGKDSLKQAVLLVLLTPKVFPLKKHESDSWAHWLDVLWLITPREF